MGQRHALIGSRKISNCALPISVFMQLSKQEVTRALMMVVEGLL
jgi:hypothetical protein